MKNNSVHIEELQSALADGTGSAVRGYLDGINENEPSNVYRLVIDEVEKPLLDAMMKYTNGNQSKAAKYLGINRATLRTKLKRYDFM